MKLLISLAWRNIWRNKRRSIITLLAVAFAVMLSIAMRGLQLGTYDVNIRSALELYSGYIQIQRTGYLQNPTLQKSFAYNADVRDILNGEPLITAYTPRLESNGLVSFGDNSLGTLILGIQPHSERQVSTLMNRLHQGNFFPSDSSSRIVVGYKLLDNLKATIGDRIVLLAQGFDGSLGNQLFTISGSIKTGSPELDGAVVLMGLSTAQELLAMPGMVSTVAIALNDLEVITPVRDRLNVPLQERQLSALQWEEMMPDMKQNIELDNISGILFLGILLVVVAFGITNTVLMSVTERFREFGVTLSIGMPYRLLVMLVLIEALFLALIGIALGNLCAAGINYYIVQNPIVMGGNVAELYAEYGFLPRLESTMRFSIFRNSSLLTLLISLMACIYPAIKVYRLEPLKGIRYT